MLKINLFSKKAKPRGLFKPDFWIFLIVLLLVIGAGIGYTMVLDMQIQSLQAVLTVKQKKVKKMGTYQKKIKELEKKVTAFKQRIEVIKNIRQKQNLPVIYLDVLVSHLPKRKLWFNNLQLNGDKIRFKGVALDNQVLARYIEVLRRSRYVQKAAIVFTSRKKVDKYDLVNFECFVVMGKNISEMPKDKNIKK